MNHKTVSSTEFQRHSGVYMEQAGKEPVIITKHDRPARVLMDYDEFERLNAGDGRRETLARLRQESHERFASLYEKLAW